MSDPRDALINHLERQLSDAYRAIHVLVERAGGEVSVTQAELESAPSSASLSTMPDPATGSLILRVDKLWYYEGRPDQHCEMVSWISEDVTLRPLDGSPQFTCNGSFAYPVRNLS